MLTKSYQNAIAALAWLALAVVHPAPHAITWPLVLIFFGILIVVPNFYATANASAMAFLGRQWVLVLHAAGFLAYFGYLLGINTGLFCIPWLLATGAMAVAALVGWSKGAKSVARLAVASGFIQLPVGAAWLLADAFQWEPLGFDAMVVRLTAAHFHFAGFVLPIVAGWTLAAMPRYQKWLAPVVIGVCGGVMLVATGITATKFGQPILVECLLAAVFACFVLALGVFLLAHGLKRRNAWLIVSALSLLFAMSLALLYALRLWISVPWTQLPSMWAIHGNLQVFGFTLCGLIGWRREFRQENYTPF